MRHCRSTINCAVQHNHRKDQRLLETLNCKTRAAGQIGAATPQRHMRAVLTVNTLQICSVG